MNFERYYKIFAILSALTVFLPLLSSFKRRKTLWGNKVFFVTLAYLLVCLFTEICNFITLYFSENNFTVGNIFYLVEFLLITQIYRIVFSENRNAKRIIFLSRLICLVFFIYGINANILGLFKGTSACVIMVLSVLLFYQLLADFEYDTEVNFSDNSIFILNCAILIYFSATFFVFLFEPLVNQGGIFAMMLWTVPLFFSLVFYLMLNHAICKMKNT